MNKDKKYHDEFTSLISKGESDTNIIISLSGLLDILHKPQHNTVSDLKIDKIKELVDDLQTVIKDAQNTLADIQTLQKEFNSSFQNFNKQYEEIKKLIHYVPRINRMVDKFYEKRMSNSCSSYLPDDEQKISPLYQYAVEIRKQLVAHDIENYQLIKVGGKHDGGYMMIDDFNDQTIAYSCGISNDVSWDKDMAKRGILVFMYDHTINALPEENPLFHWHKIGICGNNRRQDCLSLAELIQQNNHLGNNNLILKMDIECAEYEAINDLPLDILAQFKQIILEMHSIQNFSRKKAIMNFLKKLNTNHKLFDIHANNYGRCIYAGGLALPDALEISLGRAADYTFIMNDHYYPREFHRPNDPHVPDIQLGLWNKFSLPANISI